MKVGDLVCCKYATGKPIGIIVGAEKSPTGSLIFNILIKGRIWPGRKEVLEVINENR
jgi:hypothetical protein